MNLLKKLFPPTALSRYVVVFFSVFLVFACTIWASPAQAAFVKIDDFEGHTLGSDVDTAGGWIEFGTAGGSIVLDPDNASTRVAQLTGAAAEAGYQVPLGANAIPDDGSEATVFFRYRTTGSLSVYLTDADTIPAANWYSEDEMGLYNNDLSATSNIHGHYNTGVATTMNLGEWHNVWIHVLNETTPSSPFSPGNSERYFLYIDGVLINGTDGNSDDSFATRSWTTNVPVIDTLFFVSNNAGGGGLIDDIYIDNTGLNLNNPLAVPEPPASLLLALGMIGMGVWGLGGRRRSRSEDLR